LLSTQLFNPTYKQSMIFLVLFCLALLLGTVVALSMLYIPVEMEYPADDNQHSSNHTAPCTRATSRKYSSSLARVAAIVSRTTPKAHL
jgi:hypothetical protein